MADLRESARDPRGDFMQATPREPISGFLSDLTASLYSPERTQTLQGIARFFDVPELSRTLNRISYGEPITNIGKANVPLIPDDTAAAALLVAPLVTKGTQFGAKAGRLGVKVLGQEIADRVTTGQSLLPKQLPDTRAAMFAVEPSATMPKPQAPVSELGFYSAAEQAALNLPRNKGTGQSFLNDLMKAPDVKKDELAWTGLDDFLKDKPNVTKQEVQDFIANNKVDLQEVRLGESPVEDPIGIAQRKAVFDKYEPQIQALYKDMDSYGYDTPREVLQSTDNRLRKLQEMRDAEADAYYVIPEPTPTKYSKYQLAGGENYREILLKLPQKETRTPNMIEYEKLGQQMFGGALNPTERARLDELENLLSREERSMALSGGKSKTSVYQSSHFNEPNILAHMRVNDRIDADGKKMLLVEEIQSDWHQAGREKGYKGKGTLRELPDNYFVQEIKTIDGDTMYVVRDTSNPSVIINKDYNRQSAINGVINELNSSSVGGVPDAPFKDTWYQLSLKRILKYAADNGYERVGLTTGKQQAERYKLSNEVDEINVTGRTNMATGEKSKSVALDLTSGTQYRLGVDNNGVIDNVNNADIANFKGKKLSEVVGKDIAKQIMEGSSQTIKGEGLNIGGEGMKKYYDEIYPKFLEKYGKKWDAGVGETTITTDRTRDAQGIPSMYPTKEPIRYIDITPKMKESVSKGQPLFSVAPAGALGLGGLEYTDPFGNLFPQQQSQAQQSAQPIAVKPKTWDAAAAQRAKMLEDMGTDPKTIWQQTGTWKGPDGKWRQEVMQ